MIEEAKLLIEERDREKLANLYNCVRYAKKRKNELEHLMTVLEDYVVEFIILRSYAFDKGLYN